MPSPDHTEDGRYQNLPDEDELSESSRSTSPGLRDMTAEWESLARRRHAKLIGLGGRPSRSIRSQPMYKPWPNGTVTIYGDNNNVICNCEEDMLMEEHWGSEDDKFEAELEQWQAFRKFQQRSQHRPPPIPWLKSQNTDERLARVVVKLNDWRWFERYQQKTIQLYLDFREKIRRAVEYAHRSESTLGSSPKDPTHNTTLRYYLSKVKERRREMKPLEDKLTWIKSQFPEILEEASDALATTPSLRSALENMLQSQAEAVYQDLLVDHGGIHCMHVEPPLPSASYLQRICHLNSEISRLLEERREWRMFRSWRKCMTDLGKIDASKGQEDARQDLMLWKDYVSYREYELERAKSWVDCWRRLLLWGEQKVEWRENGYETDNSDPDAMGFGLDLLREDAEDTRKSVEMYKEDILIAEVQLAKARNLLTHALQQISNASPVGLTQHRTPPTPPSTGDAPPKPQQIPNVNPMGPTQHQTPPTSPPTAEASPEAAYTCIASNMSGDLPRGGAGCVRSRKVWRLVVQAEIGTSPRMSQYRKIEELIPLRGSPVPFVPSSEKQRREPTSSTTQGKRIKKRSYGEVDSTNSDEPPRKRTKIWRDNNEADAGKIESKGIKKRGHDEVDSTHADELPSKRSKLSNGNDELDAIGVGKPGHQNTILPESSHLPPRANGIPSRKDEIKASPGPTLAAKIINGTRSRRPGKELKTTQKRQVTIKNGAQPVIASSETITKTHRYKPCQNSKQDSSPPPIISALPRRSERLKEKFMRSRAENSIQLPQSPTDIPRSTIAATPRRSERLRQKNLMQVSSTGVKAKPIGSSRVLKEKLRAGRGRKKSCQT